MTDPYFMSTLRNLEEVKNGTEKHEFCQKPMHFMKKGSARLIT